MADEAEERALRRILERWEMQDLTPDARQLEVIRKSWIYTRVLFEERWRELGRSMVREFEKTRVGRWLKSVTPKQG